ncbi:hypothetical protein DB346_18715 [Verrucomicrobia bacterium LW23]|nr:hypothetical protein DB346_18715 [Verrucomicrobia bacterium LW23]
MYASDALLGTADPFDEGLFVIIYFSNVFFSFAFIMGCIVAVLAVLRQLRKRDEEHARTRKAAMAKARAELDAELTGFPAHIPLRERLARAEEQVAARPEDPDAWKERANLRRTSSDLPGALADFQKARELLEPAPGAPWLEHVDIADREGFTQTLAAVQQVVAVRWEIAEVYLQMHQPQAAAETLDALLMLLAGIDPQAQASHAYRKLLLGSIAHVHKMRSGCRAELGDRAGAEKDFATATAHALAHEEVFARAQPAQAGSYRYRETSALFAEANRLINNGLLDAALPLIREFQSRIAGHYDVDSGLTTAMGYQQLLLIGLEEPPKAKPAAAARFVGDLEKEPPSLTGTLLAATVRASVADSPAALAGLTACLRQHPACIPVLRQRGNLLRQMGRAEEAMADFARILELDEFDASSWLKIALIHRAAGRLPEALAAFDSTLKLAPHDALARYFRARTQAAAGRTQEAATDLTELERAAPELARRLGIS